MMDSLLAVMRFSSNFELNAKNSDKIPIVQRLIIISMFLSLLCLYNSILQRYNTSVNWCHFISQK